MKSCEYEWFKKLNHGMLIGLSGFITLFVSIMFTFVWLPYFTHSKTYISNQAINEWVETLEINPFMTVLLLASLVIFIVSMLIKAKGETKIFTVVGIFVLMGMNFYGLVSVLMTQKLTTFYMIIMWITGYLGLLLVVISFKRLHTWLLIKKDEEKDFNVVKITLVWGVIVFILATM